MAKVWRVCDLPLNVYYTAVQNLAVNEKEETI